MGIMPVAGMRPSVGLIPTTPLVEAGHTMEQSVSVPMASAVNLNIDLDVVLCVLAQALLAAFRLRLPGNYDHATPDTLQRRFLATPGAISSNGASITVKITRRAYSPVLRHASLPASTTVPWWDGRQLRFEFT